MKNPEIFFDKEAMHKVITNLLSNAIKFTPDDGSISLYIATLPAKNNKEESLYLCVSDTGTGIPEQDITQIFDRFYQSRKQAQYPVYGQTGTGIGLYLCRRILNRLSHTVSVESEPGIGTKIRLHLDTVQLETE